MDLQTQSMLDSAGDDRIITVGQDEETKKYHGLLYVNHPPPSGVDRYLLALSDNRWWDDKEVAEKEFKKSLEEANI